MAPELNVRNWIRPAILASEVVSFAVVELLGDDIADPVRAGTCGKVLSELSVTLRSRKWLATTAKSDRRNTYLL